MNETSRELLDALLQAAVPEVEDFESFDVGEKAQFLWQDITDAAELGDADAEAVMQHIGRIGCQKAIHIYKNSVKRTTLKILHHDGSVETRVSQAIRGIPKTRKETGERYHQQMLWVEMGYEDILALFAFVDRVFARAAEKRAAFQRVVAAYRAYPEAVNAGDACRLAGFDPYEIEITDADVRVARAA